MIVKVCNIDFLTLSYILNEYNYRSKNIKKQTFFQNTEIYLKSGSRSLIHNQAIKSKSESTVCTCISKMSCTVQVYILQLNTNHQQLSQLTNFLLIFFICVPQKDNRIYIIMSNIVLTVLKNQF